LRARVPEKIGRSGCRPSGGAQVALGREQHKKRRVVLEVEATRQKMEVLNRVFIALSSGLFYGWNIPVLIMIYHVAFRKKGGRVILF